jgi:ubiquinone/menaquinone biosynthesis C-methylase UbiE
MKRSPSRYISRTAYLDPETAGSYERDRFSGALGRYRWRREMDGVGAIVEMLPAGVSILDCPCGVGRWWPVLERRASRIRAVDLSPAMLGEAERRVDSVAVPVEVSEGDAERLELADASVDAVFSHALTKHLPIPLQQRVLAEFARVSREWVICSFSLLNHLTYELWRRRELVDSNALLPEQLNDLAAAAGLTEVARRRCTTPVGVEHSVLFRKGSG